MSIEYLGRKGRKRNAMARLEATLAAGTKKTKAGEVVSITDADRKRIEKEIGILKDRI